MRIDKVSFTITVSYANGLKQVISDDTCIEFDYAGSHYIGKVKSIRKTRGYGDFVIYVYCKSDFDDVLRMLDFGMWQIENLEVLNERSV